MGEKKRELNKWQKYELYKGNLRKDLTPDEYEHQIKEITKRLKT